MINKKEKPKMIKMVKPDKTERLVYPEDVEHRKSIGWKVVKTPKQSVMNIQNSKVAKTLDVGVYRFIAYIVVAVFLAGGAWMLMGVNIKSNTLHKGNADVHLSTDNIISNVTMDNQVRMNVDNIDDLEEKVDKHSEVINRLVTSDAVQTTRFQSIDEKLQILIDNN